jgi:hypothetical protein
LRGNLSMREDHAISFDAIFGKSRAAAEGDLKAVFAFLVHNETGFRLAFHRDERLPHPLEKYSAKN